MPRFLLAACAALSLCLPTGALADTNPLLAQARQLHLADDAYWRVLLYYNADGKNAEGQPRYRSAVAQTTFFVSSEGRNSPEAELEADLGTWLGENTPAPGASLACHFPARIAWLRERLHISADQHPPAVCPELDNWLAAIHPQQATLVFASAYLNNPSSMFGHTLLRIDTPEQTEATRLLAYAINYAAETKDSNGVLFAVKGLTGGYPGAFSIMPYYQKVKEYNDFENRDLWEYQLSLSPEEITRLLQHLWEMRGISFPYYFFSDNCSYELLGLVEAARPGLALRQRFPSYAIPIDTARAVLDQPGLLKAVVYRPSSATRLTAEIQRNSAAVNDAARTLMQEPAAATPGLSPEQRAEAQETAYDDLYYRYLGHQAPAASTPPLLRALLVARSQTEVPDQRTPPPRPAVDPASGHASSRFSLGSGVSAGQAVLRLDLRPAYHDLLDPPGGYVAGARIDFLDTGLSYTPARGQLRLDHFTLFAIDSLSPRNAFLKPLSWGGAMGLRQVPVDADGRFSRHERHPVSYAEGSSGFSYSPAGGLLCYGQLQVQAEAGPALQRGWRDAAGPRLGYLGATPRGQWQAEAGSLYRHDQQAWESSALLGWQSQLGPTQALRLSLTVTAENGQRAAGGSLDWFHYF